MRGLYNITLAIVQCLSQYGSDDLPPVKTEARAALRITLEEVLMANGEVLSTGRSAGCEQGHNSTRKKLESTDEYGIFK